MTKETFRKTLSANDVGATGGHQGGILIPKSQRELIACLPRLDPRIKNPDAWIGCIDEDGNNLLFRYVYYNNRLHETKGTRNEYRFTYMTQYFRDVGARAGDVFEISRVEGKTRYAVRVIRERGKDQREGQPVRIKLVGWRRIH